MKICGLWVDIQEVQWPFCKVAAIKEFWDLIYNGKFHGRSPRCGEPVKRLGPRRHLTAARALGLTEAHRRVQQG
jgi:hypothetical protein